MTHHFVGERFTMTGAEIVYRPCGLSVTAATRDEAIETFRRLYFDGPNSISKRDHWRNVRLDGELVLR